MSQVMMIKVILIERKWVSITNDEARLGFISRCDDDVGLTLEGFVRTTVVLIDVGRLVTAVTMVNDVAVEDEVDNVDVRVPTSGTTDISAILLCCCTSIWIPKIQFNCFKGKIVDCLFKKRLTSDTNRLIGWSKNVGTVASVVICVKLYKLTFLIDLYNVFKCYLDLGREIERIWERTRWLPDWWLCYNSSLCWHLLINHARSQLY